MWTDQAPLADLQHLLKPVVHAPLSWTEQPDFAELDAGLAPAAGALPAALPILVG